MPERGLGAFTFTHTQHALAFLLLLLVVFGKHGESTPVTRTLRYRRRSRLTDRGAVSTISISPSRVSARQLGIDEGQLGDIKATGGAAVEEVPSDTLDDYESDSDPTVALKQDDLVLYTSMTSGGGQFQETASRITKEKIDAGEKKAMAGGKNDTSSTQTLALKFSSPAAIIGMSLGGVVLALLIVLSCCCCCKCFNKQ